MKYFLKWQNSLSNKMPKCPKKTHSQMPICPYFAIGLEIEVQKRNK